MKRHKFPSSLIGTICHSSLKTLTVFSSNKPLEACIIKVFVLAGDSGYLFHHALVGIEIRLGELDKGAKGGKRGYNWGIFV